MAFELLIRCNERDIATLIYEPQTDAFDLRYAVSWLGGDDSFPLSPVLPLQRPAAGYSPGAVRRFIENLLPEGRGLEVAAAQIHVARNNLFGLISALGSETAGALSFHPPAEAARPPLGAAPREVTLEELRQRIAQRAAVPFAVWDGKVRLSVPGLQDKLPVFVNDDGRMFLAEPPRASTHILKPEPHDPRVPHLVANEHFCMSLAARLGLPSAPVRVLRVPEPILVVARFDRERAISPNGEPMVRKLHIVDGCQVADRAVAAKYERNFGAGRDVRHIRDGVSFEALFSACTAHAVNKVSDKLALLRWALFQFLTGNSDAHGKNYSFFMGRAGVTGAPWYDLVSVVQYPHLDFDLAMAFGNEFEPNAVNAFDLVDFARRCGITKSLLVREMTRLGGLMQRHARTAADADGYVGDERAMVRKIADHCEGKARRLASLAPLVQKVKTAEAA